MVSREMQYKQGFNMRVWLGNNSTMGLGAFPDFNPPDRIGLEYPVGSGIEHLYGAGPWLGALVDTSSSGPPRVIKAVTTGYGGGSGGFTGEMRGSQTPSDTFYHTSTLMAGVPNKRFFDDDNDGRVDEDDLDGIDNDGDGLIDEDYAAVSESDVYVSYTDAFPTPIIVGHTPLGIKIWQKSYAWGTAVKDPIIALEYNFVNAGRWNFDSVYLGFFADADVGPTNVGGYYTRNLAGYFADVRTAYVYNAADKPSTPIGFTVLGTPRRLDSLRYTFEWHPIENNPANDVAAYELMSSGRIAADAPMSMTSDAQIFFGFGPFGTMRPHDTLRIVMALVSGQGIDLGKNNLHDNAVKALELYAHGYSTPVVPPSPPLRVRLGNNTDTLDWKWRPGDPRFDPLETWDDSSKFVEALPDTDWRRRNPPVGKIHGGRVFEGFRVWRSESPIYNPNSFALLRQFDVDDALHFEYGTGLRYSYIDSNLVRGRKYWYAVTSFSIPNATVVVIPDPQGGPARLDTLLTDEMESDISENASLIQLPFAPSNRLGEVKVVPNPYRIDVDYTAEGGGWEGLGRLWTENSRQIWFIHLPSRATIRIFSLNGGLIASLLHDDGTRDVPGRPVGQEEWNLLSQSGRAIASGVYIFTVESDLGRQIGKFVVIR